MMSFARWTGWLLLAVVFAGLAGVVRGEPRVPDSPSPRYVHDDAGWLGAHVFTELDLKLEKFERESSVQVVVAVFPRLPEGAELFDYSRRIFDAWAPGREGKDNGVILLVFAEDRKIRIETGYGMEGVLPDARCARIIREVMAPRILEGDREGGVEAGVEAILAAARGEYQGDGSTGAGRGPGSWVILLFVFGFILLGLRFPVLFQVADVIFTGAGTVRSSGGGGWSGGGGGRGGGGFSGGGGRGGGGGASGGW